MVSPTGEDSGFILHVLVVGFHHKHGPQLEYCFPPLAPDQPSDSGQLPDEWKHLPSMALPDGSHNYEEDSVYFVVPSLTKKDRTVFCVSCYRQIDADKLVAKSEDVTRSSVQKALVAVSKVPAFGAVRERLGQAAQAYFALRDFSRVNILRDTFAELRRDISKDTVMPQLYTGLSVKDLLLRYRQKLLVLFKLLLLERRVLFFMGPVSELTNTMVTLVSLYPNILEDGLDRCANVVSSKYNVRNVAGTDYVSIEKDADSDASVDDCSDLVQQQSAEPAPSERQQQEQQQRDEEQQQQQEQQEQQQQEDGTEATPDAVGGGGRLQGAWSGASSLFSSVRTSFMSRVAAPPSTEAEAEAEADDGAVADTEAGADRLQSPFITDDYGFPLPLFAESGLLLPYVSLHQLQLLDDAGVRACLLGASNAVFKDNRRKLHAVVGADQADFAINDRQLARQLRLSGPDDAFVQLLVANAVPAADQPAEVECSNDWLRAQFRTYLLALLQAAKSQEPEDWQDFNANYIAALQKTYHFKVWSAHDHRGLAGVEHPGQHPCHGQSAIGAKFNNFLSNTEQGRRVTNAVQSTGRVIEGTGKAVGGAIVNARSAMSGFFSGLSTRASSRFGGSGVEASEETPAKATDPAEAEAAAAADSEQPQ